MRLLLALLLLAILGLLVLWWTREQFLLPQLERRLIRAAEERGLTVSLEDTSLELDSLLIEGLRVSSEAEAEFAALAHLDAPSVRVDGRLWRLPFDGIAALEAIDLDVDTLHLRESVAGKEPASNSEPRAFSIDHLPEVTLRGNRVLWERESGAILQANALSSMLRTENGEAKFELQLNLDEGLLRATGEVQTDRTRIALNLAALPLRDLAVLWNGEESLAGLATGELEVELPFDDPLAFTVAPGPLEVTSLDAYGFRTESLRAQAAWNAGTLALEGLEVRDGGRLLRSNKLRLGVFDLGSKESAGGKLLLHRGEAVLDECVADFDLQLDALEPWLGAWVSKELLAEISLTELRARGRLDGRAGAHLQSASLSTKRADAELRELSLLPATRAGAQVWEFSDWREFNLKSSELDVTIADLSLWTDGLAGRLKFRGAPQGKLGSLRGQLSANGTLGAIGSTPDQQQPVALELELAEFAEQSSSLDIRQLELRSGDEVLLRGDGLLAWGNKANGASRDPFTAELDIGEIADHLPTGGLPALFPGAPDVSGPLSGRISFERGFSSASMGTLELRSAALQMRFTGASGEAALLGPARLEGLARLQGESLSIEQLTLSDDAAAFTLEGRGSVSKKADTSGSPLLDLSAEIDLADISGLSGPLSALLGMRLPLRAGSLRGTAEWKGPLSSPTLHSQLQLEEGVLALGSPLPAATAVVAELQLEPGQLKIEKLQGELGASPFTLTGHIDLPSGASPQLDLQLKGDNLLFARSRTLRVRADADLALQGAVEELRAKGSLLLRGGRLTAPVEFLDFSRRGASTRSEAARGLQIFSLPEPPLSKMRFNVQVRTAEPFTIDNNVAKGAVRPSLQLRGTGEVPLLEGEVFIDPTVVTLPATRLKVNSGRVDFDRSDPFYPTLAIQGSSRIRGIEIEARVAGRFDEPEIFLSSTPAQPGEDLVYLLLTGQLPESSFASSSRQAAQSLAVYFAQDFIQRWFGGGSAVDDEESFADRIDFQRGQDVSRSGSETLQASFRLQRDVTLKNDALYLTAEKDVYDHVNFGLRLVFRFR